MPKGITEELLNDVWVESTWQFYSLYKYPSVEESARVSGGFLLKDIWKVCVTGIVHVLCTQLFACIVAQPCYWFRVSIVMQIPIIFKN